MNGAQEIAKERIRQQLPAGVSQPVKVTAFGGAVELRGEKMDGEGYYCDHDDKHVKKELVRDGAMPLLQSYINGPQNYVSHGSDTWGLGRKHNQDPRRALVLAGALIAAEIDRLDRKETHDR